MKKVLTDQERMLKALKWELKFFDPENKILVSNLYQSAFPDRKKLEREELSTQYEELINQAEAAGLFTDPVQKLSIQPGIPFNYEISPLNPFEDFDYMEYKENTWCGPSEELVFDLKTKTISYKLHEYRRKKSLQFHKDDIPDTYWNKITELMRKCHFDKWMEFIPMNGLDGTTWNLLLKKGDTFVCKSMGINGYHPDYEDMFLELKQLCCQIFTNEIRAAKKLGKDR